MDDAVSRWELRCVGVHNDLAYCAKHELDLFYEGEYNDFKSKRVVAAAEKYVLLLTGKTYRERLQGLGTK